MITFRARFSFPEFNHKKYTDALQKQCEEQLRQAAREWLRAVIPGVPVFTGTARGALQPLGRFLRVAVPISPVAVRKNRGPGVGAAQSHFKFERRQHRFVFKFDPGVFHFIQNEFYHAPNPPFRLINPTPWNALIAGKNAFDSYLIKVLPGKIPRIADYLRFRVKRINP